MKRHRHRHKPGEVVSLEALGVLQALVQVQHLRIKVLRSNVHDQEKEYLTSS